MVDVDAKHNPRLKAKAKSRQDEPLHSDSVKPGSYQVTVNKVRTADTFSQLLQGINYDSVFVEAFNGTEKQSDGTLRSLSHGVMFSSSVFSGLTRAHLTCSFWSTPRLIHG